MFKQDIDIRDIELLKIREHEGGVFMISFENEQKAAQAVNILQSINYNAFICSIFLNSDNYDKFAKKNSNLILLSFYQYSFLYTILFCY